MLTFFGPGLVLYALSYASPSALPTFFRLTPFASSSASYACKIRHQTTKGGKSSHVQCFRIHPRFHRGSFSTQNLPYIRKVRHLYSTFHHELDACCHVHSHECLAMGQPCLRRIEFDRCSRSPPSCCSLLCLGRIEEPGVCWK